MSVTIRLSRIGKTGSPAFKIVVANTKDKLDGRAVEILGHYNPSHNPPLLQIDKDKFNDWKKKGAIVTPAVAQIVEDKYEFKPYTRQNEMKDDDNAQVAQAATVAEKKTQAAEEAIAAKVEVAEEAQVAEVQAAEEAQATKVEEIPAEDA